MNVYGNTRDEREAARVDVDMIAFHVSPEEVEIITDYLVAAIVTRCLVEFGQAPVIE